MNRKMIGSHKHGWLVDNEKREFVYFDLLSLFEKMQGKPSKHVISYADIDYIRIDYSLVDPVKGMGSTTLILEVHKNNGEIESVPIFTFAVERKDYNEFIQVLKDSQLKIVDPQKCLDLILESQELIGTIISQLIKKAREVTP